MLAQHIYDAGAWEVDGDRRELRAHGQLVPIGSRAFEIIEKLAESAGHVVTKDELVAHVWRGIVVEDNTLQVHIHAIRKALGPDRTLLKTDPGRGYRLLGRWTTKQDAKPKDDIDPTGPSTTRDDCFRSNLPAASFTIVGRTSALRQLRDFVTAYRAVTLVGPPGIGKTTLAIELARDLRAEFDDCACLVELAPLVNPNLVLPTVASTLGLNFESERATAEAVAQGIGGRRLVLLLDNCEHVLEATAELSGALMRHCPHTLLLATSREAMKTPGEHVYRVPPLEVPKSSHPRPERLLEFSAVELFVSRTQALDDRFAPGPSELSEIASICRRLDGIPLAIEFAAARAATLGVGQVEAGLRNRFEMLTNRRRTALPRHRTLRAALDWSYELLRGRGGPGKVAVFGLLKRGGRVYTKMIPNVGRSALMPIIKAKIQADSIVYTDAFVSYDSLDVSGFHHHRINHRESFAERGGNHINGIENFWNQAKRHLRKYNGIPKHHFHLFLKECEWRFNYGSPSQLLSTLKTWIKLQNSWDSPKDVSSALARLTADRRGWRHDQARRHGLAPLGHRRGGAASWRITVLRLAYSGCLGLLRRWQMPPARRQNSRWLPLLKPLR